MQKFIQSMHINVLGQDKDETLDSLLIPPIAEWNRLEGDTTFDIYSELEE